MLPTQVHNLLVANTSHNHTVDGLLSLIQHLTLAAPDSTVHGLASDTFWVIQHGTLEVDNSAHRLRDVLERVISWADYGVFGGVYRPNRSESGDIDTSELPEDKIYKKQTTQVQAFGISELPVPDIYKPQHPKSGKY